jgi:Protein of unknown function (DUF4242)
MAQGIAARVSEESGGVTQQTVRKQEMADVFVEWAGRPSSDGRTQAEIESSGCFDLHKVQLQESFIADGARRVLCHFRAPDAESVRLALRQGDISVDSIWTGIVLEGTLPAAANVVIEHDLAPPLPPQPRDALEFVCSHWLQPLGLTLASAVVNGARNRLLLFCEAHGSSFGLDDTAHRVSPGFAWSCRRVATSDAEQRRD